MLKSKGFNSYTKQKILNHALKEDNISKTCELFGISRTTFYNWQRAYQRYGVVGLEEKERKKPEMPNKVSKEIERDILTYVTKYPKDGPRRIYYELKSEGIDLGESGIYNVLKNNDLNNMKQRVEFARNKSKHLKSKRESKIKFTDLFSTNDSYPGYLVIQKIDYIGAFDGIGRIYQYCVFDTDSKWGEIKLYNRKQDIDIWQYFEHKLVYLLETFNLNIENLITEKEREFLPYFVKGDKYQEIIDEFKIKHIFISPTDTEVLDDIRKFNAFLSTEFYNKIPFNNSLDSFEKVEDAMNNFIREYNFSNIISKGNNKGKSPAEAVLGRAIENGADLDTLPLWLLALINSSKRGGFGE